MKLICQRCGATFEAKRLSAKYCRGSCRSQRYKSGSPIPPAAVAAPADGNGAMTWAQRKEAAQAEMVELELATRRGELVPAAGVEAEFADMRVAARTKFLGLPSQAAERLPHLTADDLEVLDQLVREALEEFARKEEAELDDDDG